MKRITDIFLYENIYFGAEENLNKYKSKWENKFADCNKVSASTFLYWKQNMYFLFPFLVNFFFDFKIFRIPLKKKMLSFL